MLKSLKKDTLKNRVLTIHDEKKFKLSNKC